MEKLLKLKNKIIDKESSIIDALKKMSATDSKLLMVMQNNRYYGLLSIGDIQRGILGGIDLNGKIEKILRSSFKVAKSDDAFEEIKKMIFDFRMEFCPVVDLNGEVINVYFWEDVFETVNKPINTKFNLPVVIMAGGFGTRLKPLTNILPKPLIPIGEKTMLEEIFEKFNQYGCDDFYVSINYKSELINFYLSTLTTSYKISCFKEDKPLGTAGSLKLLKGKLNGTFFVNNCDILINEDYSDMLKYHRECNNDITIIAAIKTFNIPYGTVEVGDKGRLKAIKEKPDFNFLVNSGMYILESDILNIVPENEYYHITNLIEEVMSRNGKIGVYPVSENSWLDVGNWDEYLRLIHKK